MEIFQIWKKYNISLVLILPIFNDITTNITSFIGGIRYPITQLTLEYGLINCYLYNKKCKFDGHMYLLFDREKFIYNWKDKVKTSYWSLCSAMVDSKYYSTMEIDNDYVVIGLRIPTEYYESIQIIEGGKYYDLSFDYKEMLRLKQKQVPITTNKLAMYIVSNDLPYAISIKALHLKDELENALDITLNKNDEFFQQFIPDKECYRPSLIRKHQTEFNI